MLTVTVEEGQKTGDQSKSPPPAPVVPNSVPRKVSPTPIVKSSTTTLPKSSSPSSITALLGTRPRRATGRTLGSRNPDFQVSLLISKMCSLRYQPPLLVQSLFLTSRLRITQINIKQFKQLCGSYMCLILHKLTFCHKVDAAILPPITGGASRELRNVSPSSTTTSGTPSSRYFLCPNPFDQIHPCPSSSFFQS